MGDGESPSGAKTFQHCCQVHNPGQDLLLSIDSKNKQVCPRWAELHNGVFCCVHLYQSLVAAWGHLLKMTQFHCPEFKDSSGTTWLNAWPLYNPSSSTSGLPLLQPSLPVSSPEPAGEEGPGYMVLAGLQFSVLLVWLQGVLPPTQASLQEVRIRSSCPALGNSGTVLVSEGCSSSTPDWAVTRLYGSDKPVAKETKWCMASEAE